MLITDLKRIPAALICLASTALAAAAQCPIKPSPGLKAPEWDAVFTQYGPGKGLEPAGSPGWTGGDSTFSLLLPNGDSAFFFSDSYIAESPARKGDGTVTLRADGARVTEINCTPPACDPPASDFVARNSIVVRSRDGKRLTTITGAKNDRGLSTSVFKEPAPERYYWLGDQAILPGGKAAVFLHKFDPKLEFHGATIAELDPKTLAVGNLYEAILPNNAIHWGTSVMEENKVLYIYGKGTVDGKKLPFVARTRSYRTAKDAADTQKWEAWDGTKWVRGLAAAAPLVDASDSVSDEFSVERFDIGGKPTLVMVALDTTVPFHDWRDITLYSACDPQGPFAGKHVIYAMPESKSKTVEGTRGPIPLKSALVVYNPHIHKQFTKSGKLLISYNSNRVDNADSIYIDGYRPRFIWVPVAGLR